MVDIDKVIKAWEIFRDSNPYQICEGIEFRAISEPEYCMSQMIADTLELLKEKRKEGHWKNVSFSIGKCSECDFGFGNIHTARYCPKCGAYMRNGGYSLIKDGVKELIEKGYIPDKDGVWHYNVQDGEQDG